MPTRCQAEYGYLNAAPKEGCISRKSMKPLTAQLGVRENPASLLRQHGSCLEANSLTAGNTRNANNSCEDGMSSVVIGDEKGSLDHDERGVEFEPLLDVAEAATLLRIHPRTLRVKARSGVIPAIRIGRVWRFRVSALNRWLERIAS